MSAPTECGTDRKQEKAWCATVLCMWYPGHSLAEEEGSTRGRWQKSSHAIGTNQNTGGALSGTSSAWTSRIKRRWTWAILLMRLKPGRLASQVTAKPNSKLLGLAPYFHSFHSRIQELALKLILFIRITHTKASEYTDRKFIQMESSLRLRIMN